MIKSKQDLSLANSRAKSILINNSNTQISLDTKPSTSFSRQVTSDSKKPLIQQAAVNVLAKFVPTNTKRLVSRDFSYEEKESPLPKTSEVKMKTDPEFQQK